jgi:hypothetical protein
MNKSKEVPACLLITGRDPPVLLHQVDEPFDLLEFLVQMFVVLTPYIPILLVREYCVGSLPLRRRHNRVSVVVLVSDKRIRLMPVDQRPRLRDVGLLTGRQEEPDQVPQRVDEDVDLGADSAPGSAEGLAALSPFFPGRMLVRPDHGAVEDHPFQVGVPQRLEDPLPDPLGTPAVELLPDRIPATEPLGQVTPRCPGLGDPVGGVDEEAIVLGGHAGVARFAGEEVIDAFPVVFRDFVATHRESSD